MALTTVYLIRHAHADWRNDDDRGLSASGLRDAHVIGERLFAQPIAAVYSSPHRRSVETVEPLAQRLGVRLNLVADLRERELPVVDAGDFNGLVESAWRAPGTAIQGGESNVTAQARGLAVMRDVVGRHQGRHVAVGTHGNLLALILNGLDSAFGYEFWKGLSFPDVYQLELDGATLISAERLWDRAA